METVLTEPEHFCTMQNDSIWDAASGSCFVWFRPHLPWTQAMQYCAKCGSLLPPLPL